MAGRIITAIDIGSSKISTIIASLEEGSAPSVIGVSTYPSNGLKKGVIVNIDDAINSIANSLEAAERMAGLTVSSAYISINGNHITSINNKGVVAVAQDEITNDDVFRSIESARTISIPPSREILHVIPREFVVDAQGDIKDPVGMSGNRLEVNAHIISATSSALHNLVKCVQQLGLRIDDVVFTGWASASSVLTPTEKELGVMLLDIGGGATSVTTFVEDTVTYSGSVPFGGANITIDLAVGLRTSLEDAEKIKINFEDLQKGHYSDLDLPLDKPKALGSGDKDKNDPSKKLVQSKKRADDLDISSLDIPELRTIPKKLFKEIIEARVSEIFDIVIKHVEQSGNETRLPAGIVLTGGTALTPGITSITKKVFGVPARVGHPRGLDGLIDEINSPAYSVGYGLINYGSNEQGFDSSSRKASKTNAKPGNIGSKLSGFIKNLLP